MTTPRTKLSQASLRTREQLILAGERLFAEHGLDTVSLRQINAEAGQRNSSAAHYHFGSKESLIQAIVEFRSQRVDAVRSRFVERIAADNRTGDVRAYIEALVYPLVEEVDGAPGGKFYIRFLAQLIGHPTMDMVKMMRNRFADAIGSVYFGMRNARPDIPDEVFGGRFGLAWELTIYALADRERMSKSASVMMNHTLPVLFVSNLVDCLTGLMVAPVSAETAREVAALRAGRQRG